MFFSTSLSQNNEWAYLVERGVEEKFFIVHIKLWVIKIWDIAIKLSIIWLKERNA